MNRAIAGGVEHQVCVVDTDDSLDVAHFLDVADYYPEAIRRHIEALR